MEIIEPHGRRGYSYDTRSPRYEREPQSDGHDRWYSYDDMSYDYYPGRERRYLGRSNGAQRREIVEYDPDISKRMRDILDPYVSRPSRFDAERSRGREYYGPTGQAPMHLRGRDGDLRQRQRRRIYEY